MKKTLYALLLALGLAAPAAAQHIITPNGWYSVACPNGEYATLEVQKGLRTNTGPVALPGNQNVLYLDHACDGSGKFAGVGNVDDRAYEWVGSWALRGTAFAINPIVYQNGGALVIVSGPGPTGSQGWRYNSDQNTLVSGDATYVCPFAAHLWECTQRGDVVCGQGADEDPGTQGGGLQCVVAGRRVLVQPGQNRAIRFKGGPLQYAFGFVRQDRAEGHLLWKTRAELDALPTYELPGTPPVIPPVIPPIEPPVAQPPVLPDDVFAALQTLRPTYPTPLGDRGAALLNDVAWQFRARGWGLEAKGGGNNCPQPRTEIRVGCDILRGPGNWGYDVLGDQENLGIPLQATAGPAEAARFVPPVQPNGTTPPVDPPVEPPVDVCTPALVACRADVARLENAVVVQTARVRELEAQVVALTTERDALKAENEALKNRPPATCSVSPGWASRLGVSCKVSQ